MSDKIPQTVQDDYNTLLENLLPFAEEMLGKHGEFYPFGMALEEDGEVVAYESDDHGEMPPSEELIDSMVSFFLGEATKGKYGPPAFALIAALCRLDCKPTPSW
jgi:hypothetical protein